MNSEDSSCGQLALCEPNVYSSEIKEEPNPADCLSLNESSKGQASSLSGDSQCDGMHPDTFRSKNNEAVRKSRAKKKLKVEQAKEKLKKAEEEVVDLKDKL